jgi:hypothetical protein
MRKPTTIALFATALVAMLTPVARASIIYGTDFNSPTYSDGLLAGQDGWIVTSAGGTNDLTVANTATNGNVSMTTSGNDDRRLFPTALTGGSYFLSADINVSAAQATGDYFMHLGDGSTSIFNARTYIKSSGSGFVMALGTGAGTVGLNYGSTVLNFGTTYHVLVQYDMNPGTTNDTGALFINPADPHGVGDTPYVAATLEGIDATNMDAVYLRQGTAANAATLVVDNILVDAVGAVPVPEPASVLLCGLGLVGLFHIARSRKAV